MAVRFSPEIDETDWKLLAALESDARMSFSELGRRVGLSQPATSERIKNLEAQGIIRGYRVDVDHARLGYPISAFIRMDTSGDKCRALQQSVATMPHVLECQRITGEGSYVLRVAVASMQDLEALIDRLMPYGSPTTSIVLSTPLAARNPTQARPL